MATGSSLGQLYGGITFITFDFAGPYFLTAGINAFALLLSLFAFRNVNIHRK